MVKYADGNEVATEDPAQNGTVWAYNGLGQVTQSTQGQLIGGSSPWAFANLAPTGQMRSFEVYVHLTSAPGNNWQGEYHVSDSGGSPTLTPVSGATPSAGGWYDLGAVALAYNDNSTTVRLTQDSGSSPDEVCLGYSDHSYYNTAGQLHEQVDRNGRATTYQYDGIGRETGESWYASNTLGTPTETITYAFDAAGRLQSATDYNVTNSTTSTDSYTYDLAGEVKSDTQTIPGLTPSVALTETYTAGNRTIVAAAIGGTNDFANDYTYQGLMGQMSQVSQTSNGGNAVAAKTGAFQYDWQGELTGVGRYQNANTTANLVAHAALGYDADGNLTSLAYAKSGSTLPSYTWTFDALGNMATAWNSTDGTATYGSDSTGQLTSAGYQDSQGNESYSYDTNGNRTNSGYVTGPNNEILCDGTFNYTHDAEGNCTSRTRISSNAADDYETDYTWDNRNRLTSVTLKNNSATVTKTVTYIYDAFNRWIGETITPASGTATQTRFVYDGKQIVMQFDGAASGDLTAADLSHRYLWGPAVDQLLADEQVTNGLSQQGNVVWTLGDNQNTIRDLAIYDHGTNTTTVVNHRVFSAYGELLSQTNPSAADCLFAYTGQPLSRFSENVTTGGVTGLQNNLNRWYDAITARWLGQDPKGFAAGDRNLYRYVGNSPTNAADPTGLIMLSSTPSYVLHPGESVTLTPGSTIYIPSWLPYTITPIPIGAEYYTVPTDSGFDLVFYQNGCAPIHFVIIRQAR